jgi:hypothetical protein
VRLGFKFGERACDGGGNLKFQLPQHRLVGRGRLTERILQIRADAGVLGKRKRSQPRSRKARDDLTAMLARGAEDKIGFFHIPSFEALGETTTEINAATAEQHSRRLLDVKVIWVHSQTARKHDRRQTVRLQIETRKRFGRNAPACVAGADEQPFRPTAQRRAARFAAVKTLDISIAIVIGPTPPGTGVRAPARTAAWA